MYVVQIIKLNKIHIFERCVGFLDKKSGTFNCVSIRPSKQTELLCMADFLKGSELVMQQQLATFKED